MTTIKFYALHTDRKIRAIKFIRSLAPVIGADRIGLREAKLIVDTVQAGSVLTLDVADNLADFVMSVARDHGFATSPDTFTEIRLSDYCEYPTPEWATLNAEREYADDLPF